MTKCLDGKGEGDWINEITEGSVCFSYDEDEGTETMITDFHLCNIIILTILVILCRGIIRHHYWVQCHTNRIMREKTVQIEIE